MTTETVVYGITNIRSNPPMSNHDVAAAITAFFAHCTAREVDIAMGCEIATPVMRAIWRKVAEDHGYKSFGGSKFANENVISVRVKSGLRARAVKIHKISKGVKKIQPNRTVIVLPVVTPGGLRLKPMMTHVVSRWQDYARKDATHAKRVAIAAATFRRLRSRVAKVRRQRWSAALAGDMNALSNVSFGPGQVQGLGTHHNAGGALGKMMQLGIFPAPGVHAEVLRRWRHNPVATDHPYRFAKVRYTF